MEKVSTFNGWLYIPPMNDNSFIYFYKKIKTMRLAFFNNKCIGWEVEGERRVQPRTSE